MAKAKEEPKENSREFFRIHYTAPDNPIFEFDKNKFMVIDISEGGFKFAPKKGYVFQENDLVQGKLILGTRATLEVKGHILRVGLRDIAVKFNEKSRIPLTRIMEEQRYLIQKGKL